MLVSGPTDLISARILAVLAPAREVRLHTPMPNDDSNPQSKNTKDGIGLHSLVQAEKLMQIAFVLPSAMIVGWLAGAWADSKLHQSWLTIAGIIFGCVSGLVYVIRLAMNAEKGIGPLDSTPKSGKERTDRR